MALGFWHESHQIIRRICFCRPIVVRAGIVNHLHMVCTRILSKLFPNRCVSFIALNSIGNAYLVPGPDIIDWDARR